MTDKTQTPGEGQTPGDARGGTRVDRRIFLRGAGLAAAAIPMTASAERLAKPTDNQISGRYKDTDHVRRFYAMNRR